MANTKYIRILVVLIFTFALSVGVYAQDLQDLTDKSKVLEFSQKSEKAITGQYPALGLSFSSVLEEDGYVVVDIRLKGNKQLIARINYINETFHIKFISLKGGKLLKLTKEDLNVLHLLHVNLLRHFSTTGMPKVLDAFLSVLNLLEGYPHDEFLDVSNISAQIRPQAWTSLCESIGSSIMGTYTIGKVPYTEDETVGPCASGDCFGRCGPGCGYPPNPGIQRFTQECFNHDLCARATGGWGGPGSGCFDEWLAAVNGYLFATDCANMTGIWYDNYGTVWTITQTGSSISGTVGPTPCGTWNVTGSHDDFIVVLTATILPPIEEGCCTAFTYTGTTQCNTASGTWTNECGLSGSWSMSKGGTSAESAVISSEQEPTSTSSK